MKIIGKSTVLLLTAALLSCEALPFNYSTSKSWQISGLLENTWTTIKITDVLVDRTGGWDSIEKETLSLAPLYFWENGCRVAAEGEKADYSAQIQIRERDYNQGWRSKKSLSVEVSLWEYNGIAVEGKLPAAVGRIVSTGEKSFSSSQTLGKMLSKAIKLAVKELAAYRR